MYSLKHIKEKNHRHFLFVFDKLLSLLERLKNINLLSPFFLAATLCSAVGQLFKGWREWLESLTLMDIRG